MSLLIGILVGALLPAQTGMNTVLKGYLKSPFNASLVSFTGGLLFLTSLWLLVGQGFVLPLAELSHEPLWIWFGGLFGVIFLTGNIFLLSHLGSVQAVVLPVVGQILMGILIDSQGWFDIPQVPLTTFKVFGAVLIVLGVFIVTHSKMRTVKRAARSSTVASIFPLFGVVAGMFSAMQTAVNGHMGVLLHSPLKSATISFAMGMVLLIFICLASWPYYKKQALAQPAAKAYHPWWMWFGGIFGGLCVLVNAILAQMIGTGLTVIVLLIGSSIGSLVIDHFGLFGVKRQSINVAKITGILIMFIGVAFIKLF